MRSLHFRIRGRVQGVGYRYFAQGKARVLGLSGYVKNCEDGSVECVARGREEPLGELEEALRRGPPLGRVDTVEKRDFDGEVVSGFEIRF